jgi:hypothetical protein
MYGDSFVGGSDVSFPDVRLYRILHDHAEMINLAGMTFVVHGSDLYFDPIPDFEYDLQVFAGSTDCPYNPDSELQDFHQMQYEKLVEAARALRVIDANAIPNGKFTCIVIGTKADDPSRYILGVKGLGTFEAVAGPTVTGPTPTSTPGP